MKSALMSVAVAMVLWLASSIVVAQGAEAPPSGEKVTIQFKWRKGDKQRYKMVQDVVMEQDAGGLGLGKMEMSTTYITAQHVTEVDKKGTATIAVTYESLVYEIKSKFLNAKWDSSKPKDGDPDNDVVKAVKPLVGKTFTMMMSYEGEVVEVKGYDAILEAVIEEFEGNPMQEAMRDSLKNTLNNDFMRDSLSANYKMGPGKPVALGDKWELATLLPLPGIGAMASKFKFELDKLESGKDGPVATLVSEGTLELAPLKEGEKANPMLEPYDISISDGKVTGLYVFDVEKGVAAKSVVIQSFKMEMRMKGSDDVMLTQSSETTTEFELLAPIDDKKPEAPKDPEPKVNEGPAPKDPPK